MKDGVRQTQFMVPSTNEKRAKKKRTNFNYRHLAQTWESSYLTHANKAYKNKLDQIEVLVLLDLLGVANVQFANYYRTTSWLFYKLIGLESRLKKHLLFKTMSEKTGERLQSFFNPSSRLTFQGEAIGDDHVPFLMRGVNVLHLIPYPFPSVWHTRAVRSFLCKTQFLMHIIM